MSSDDEFGDEFDLNPADLASFDVIEQQASSTAATQPPRKQVFVPPPPPPKQIIPAKRTLGPPVRATQHLLRPPQPPAAKRQRVDNPRPHNPVVHPNPFHKAAPQYGDDDEDMPEIRVGEKGYDVCVPAGGGGAVAGAQSEKKTVARATSPTAKATLAEPWTNTRPIAGARAKSPLIPPPPARPVAVSRPQPGPIRPPVVPPPVVPPFLESKQAVASGSGMSDADRKELEVLRAERAKVFQTFAVPRGRKSDVYSLQLMKSVSEAESRRNQAQNELMAKNGEVSIIRNKLDKSTKHHHAQLEHERKMQRDLEEKLEVKEKELKREVDKFECESAFRRQEIETSAKRINPSQWSSTGRLRATSAAPGSMGPPPVPSAFYASPSVGRARGNAAALPNQILIIDTDNFLGTKANHITPSQQPAATTQSMALLGFQNSFDTSATNGSAARRSARAETMPPPMTGRGRTTPEKKGFSAKGKGKMLVEETVEEESEESMVVDSKGVSGWSGKGAGSGADDSRVGEDTEESVEEEDEWMGLMRDRKSDAGSVVAALFSHRTFVHFEVGSINVTPSTSQRASATSLSFARSNSTARYGSAQSTGRLEIPAVNPPPQTPIPTLHSLISLRLPLGTPLATVTEYEDVCRDLSSTLGQRPSAFHSNNTNLFGVHSDSISHLTRGVGSSLESLARILEEAGVIGPLISLLSLLSSLILLFPSFALHFLNVPISAAQILPPQGKRQLKLLALLARVVRRFGRPTTVVRTGEKAGRGGRPPQRTRRIRGGVGTRPVSAIDKESEERVELEPGKRIPLLSAVVEVLEGLAWRMNERAKESFVDFLAADGAVATLLDPKQPVALLTSTTRFLSSLSCQPSLFRAIVGIKFYDATDVRGSKLPIFDRLASLIVRSGSKATHHQVFTLDMCLVSLATSLLTKNADALVFVSQNASFIPELLDKVFKDTRLVWEYDGLEIGDEIMSRLKLVVARLSATVHLFYYIVCAPKASINITEYLIQSTFLGLHDRFNVAFGTLSFATLPDWAVGTVEGACLTELGYLAQEIMEDVSPQEADEIESCFVSTELDDSQSTVGDDLIFEEEDVGLSQELNA